jgi:hypothetical protein
LARTPQAEASRSLIVNIVEQESPGHVPGFVTGLMGRLCCVLAHDCFRCDAPFWSLTMKRTIAGTGGESLGIDPQATIQSGIAALPVAPLCCAREKAPQSPGRQYCAILLPVSLKGHLHISKD